MQIYISVLFASSLVTCLAGFYYQTEYKRHLQFGILRQEIITQNNQQGSNSRGDGRREENRDKKQTSRYCTQVTHS